MTLFELFGLVVTLIAVLGYLNHRFLRWPETIGITALALVLSMGITGYGLVNPGGASWARQALASINFSEVVFHGILGLLLFAGSLTLELKTMAREKGTILVLATVGVLWALHRGGPARRSGTRRERLTWISPSKMCSAMSANSLPQSSESGF